MPDEEEDEQACFLSIVGILSAHTTMTDKESPTCGTCDGKWAGAGHCEECGTFTTDPKYPEGEPDTRTVYKSQIEIPYYDTDDLVILEVRSKNKDACDDMMRMLNEFAKNYKVPHDDTPPANHE